MSTSVEARQLHACLAECRCAGQLLVAQRSEGARVREPRRQLHDGVERVRDTKVISPLLDHRRLRARVIVVLLVNGGVWVTTKARKI